MLEQIHQRLMTAKEELTTKQKLQDKALVAEQELTREKARWQELEKILKKEGRDVERLEGLSIQGLFYTVLGSKDQQLEKERQEFLAAKLKLDACSTAVGLLEERIAAIRQEIEALGDAEAAYQDAFTEKEKLVLASGILNAQKIFQITETLGRLNSELKELREAVQTGEAAATGLDEVINSLQSAKGWGTWDMLGGGLISTAIKHSRIDDARGAVHHVQHQLQVFQKELADVNPRLNTKIIVDISAFATFADYFFDGLIADWIVQSKISDSLDNAAEVRGKVAAIIEQLQRSIDTVMTEIGGLEQQRQVLIETAG